MKKKLFCMLVGAAMICSMISFAGAANQLTASAVETTTAFAVETVVQQPMSKQAYVSLMQNDALFEQVLVAQQMVKNDDGSRGMLKAYEFVPKFQTRAASTTSYPMVEYTSDYDTSKYARLYSTFTHNGSTSSCIERYTDCTLAGYKQVSLYMSGNGSSKATVTLDYSWTPVRGRGDRRLSITVDKNGSTSWVNDYR